MIGAACLYAVVCREDDVTADAAAAGPAADFEVDAGQAQADQGLLAWISNGSGYVRAFCHAQLHDDMARSR